MATQRLFMLQALQELEIGQDTFCPAAVEAVVTTMIRGVWKQIGSLSIQITVSPSKPSQDWPQSSMIVPVLGSDNLRLRIDSDPILSPTVDIWYTYRFSKLCLQIRDLFPAPASPGVAVPAFWIPLDSRWNQNINLKYDPMPIAGSKIPRRRELECIMLTLVKHFFSFGARELRFNILRSENTHVAVGYIEFGRVAPPRIGTSMSLVNFSNLATSR